MFFKIFYGGAVVNKPVHDPGFHSDGPYKPEQEEPRGILNGSPYFNFELDLTILVNTADWKSLDYKQIKKANEIIFQYADVQNKDWSCGPNSAARALRMLGCEITDYNKFRDECPHYWLFGTIGPTPNKLAQYISRVSTPHVGAQFKYLNLNQKTEFWQIITGSINQSKPVLILLERSFANLHYVNLIAFNERESRVAILDTNNSIYWINYENLCFWMNCHGHLLTAFALGDLNLITF